jgi:hypothetical protein
MNTKNLEAWEKERDLEAELMESIDHIENGQYQELNTVQVPCPMSHYEPCKADTRMS